MAILNQFSKDNRKVQIEKDNETYKVYAIIDEPDGAEKAKRASGDVDLRALKNLSVEERRRVLTQRVENGLERGLRVKKVREFLGLTQQTLSVSMGYASSYVANIEAGTHFCSPRFIKTLSDFTGVSEAYLTLESDSMYENGSVPLYVGNDVETSMAISKLYLNSDLTTEEFVERSKTFVDMLSSLQLKTSLQAALA